uniref:Uncharacterized protein n=1 Tax=uncultured Rhodospirillales bacterium HF0200_01O14 TaxID=710787 RepID=E0XTV8_9PROT|nr:hypothetical protein [uncultured Rhodospirillales bacterium HF0200_01O14]
MPVTLRPLNRAAAKTCWPGGKMRSVGYKQTRTANAHGCLARLLCRGAGNHPNCFVLFQDGAIGAVLSFRG